MLSQVCMRWACPKCKWVLIVQEQAGSFCRFIQPTNPQLLNWHVLYTEENENMQYVNVLNSRSVGISYGSERKSGLKYAVFLSLLPPSFISPHRPLQSLLATCETYAVSKPWIQKCIRLDVLICFCQSPFPIQLNSRPCVCLPLKIITQYVFPSVLIHFLSSHNFHVMAPPPRWLSFYLWFTSFLHHHYSLHRASLNPVEIVSPPSPAPCFAEHMWHPPESLGQSRIHAEHVTSSPDFRQLRGVCLLTTYSRGWGTSGD